MVIVSLLIFFGFLLGVIVVIAAEFLGFLWILKRLRSKISSDKAKISSITQLDRSNTSSQFDSQYSFKKEVTLILLQNTHFLFFFSIFVLFFFFLCETLIV
jgi:hypothetical protein